MFCFVIVFAAAAAAGYFMANNVAALAQRRFMKTESYKMLDIAAKAAIDTSLAYNVLFSKWYYIVALYGAAMLIVLALTGKTAYIILLVSDSLRRRQRFDVLPVDKNLCGIFVVRRHFQSASLLRHRGCGVCAHRAWNIHSRH